MNLTELTIQMKATEQYFPVVLFIMLYKVILTFESVDEILKCDHSNESYRAVLSFGTVYYAVQGGSNSESVDEILKCDHSDERYWAVFPVVLFIALRYFYLHPILAMTSIPQE